MLEIGPGPRRADALPRRRASRTSTPSSSTARSSRTCRGARARTSTLALRRRAPARPRARSSRRRRSSSRTCPYNVATPLVVESLDGLPSDRALVRDGAARGRRPLLRRAGDEGVRRRLGARPARGRAHRASTRSRATVFRPRPNVDSALVAFRRRALPERFRAREAGRRGRVRAPAQDARRTRSQLAGVADARAGGRRRSPRSAATPATRAEALAPPEFVALAEALAMSRAPAHREDQPRARRRARRATDGKHEVATVLQRIDLADRDRARAGGRAPRSRASPTTRSSARALERSPRARASSRAGASRIEKRDPGRRRPRRRQLRRGDRAPARERDARRAARRPSALHELAARARRRRARSSSPTGPQLGTGDGTELEPLELPQDYWVVLLLPARRARSSRPRTSTRAFDARDGAAGFDERRARAARRARRRRSGRATSPRCRRTTSPRRRSPSGCARSAPSAPTSAAPGRPSTGSSTHRAQADGRASARCGRSGAPGSRVPAWYG